MHVSADSIASDKNSTTENPASSTAPARQAERSPRRLPSCACSIVVSLSGDFHQPLSSAETVPLLELLWRHRYNTLFVNNPEIEAQDIAGEKRPVGRHAVYHLAIDR